MLKKSTAQTVLPLLLVIISISLIPTAFAPYHQQTREAMSVSTNQASYDFGDMVTIRGQGAQSYSISIKIISPSGEEITEISTFKTSAGDFLTAWIVPSGIEMGTYTIRASDASQTALTNFNVSAENIKEKQELSPKPKAKIPDWIRNNAKWWSEGSIGDNDFVSGIQYMIQKQIMLIPHLPEQSSEIAQEYVPEWVKNNAGWWAQGLISDEDFINGIQYLVKVGTIVVKTMNLTSDAFKNEGIIPSEFTCDGTDVSPQLTISNVPKNAKSLALIMDDPDAPLGTFVHWVVWNISPEKNTISKGENLSEPQGRTDFGKAGYGGPCPPSGTHRYFFKLYALDMMLELDPNSTKKELEMAIQDHIIEHATLMGKYSRN